MLLREDFQKNKMGHLTVLICIFFKKKTFLDINLEGENVNSLERSMKKLKTALVTGIKDIKLNYENCKCKKQNDISQILLRNA